MGEHTAPEIRRKTFLKFLSQQNPWNEPAGVYLKEREDRRLNLTQSEKKPTHFPYLVLPLR